MLKNYLKVALRNLLRYKIYSVVNVVGLAVGIICTLFLALFVQNELSYDSYYRKADNIFRICADFKLSGQEYHMALSGPMVGQVAVDEIPEVLERARFRSNGNKILKYEDNSYTESQISYIDNGIIDLFDIEIVEGDRTNPLVEPYTIMLDETMAHKYFGNNPAVGKVLEINNSESYKVTAIYKPIPKNTHFHFNMFMSLSTLEESKENTWLRNNFPTYIVLNSPESKKAVEQKLNGLLVKYMGPEIERVMGITLEQIEEQGGGGSFYLQSVKDIHLHSNLLGELSPNSDIKYVFIFSAIALFILVIACVNFMNISTARSATRAKEVGIRKVMGSYKQGLIRQFLTESFITTIISTILALGLAEIMLPYFNNLTSKELTLNYMDNPFILFTVLGIIIVIGLLAGSYPAFVLSSFNPVKVLKGGGSSNGKSNKLRSSLVVFQFTASIIMIISTIVVLNQLDYIQSKKLGFNKENVLIVDYAYLLGDKIESYKDEALQNLSIVSASISGFLPVPSNFNNSILFPIGRNEETVSIQQWRVDYDYIKTMNMEIVEGRDFSREFLTDSIGVILNEAAVKQFGFENPIGVRMGRPYDMNGGYTEYKVIGVVKDFHFESLRNNIGPLAMFIGENRGSISFRVNTAQINDVLDLLKTKWNEFTPGQPFNYSFLDERFNNMYRSERNLSDIFGIFALLAISIGCLGLFSLSAFTAEQKTKEIGIRKVLGSSVAGIVVLLSKEFIKLIVIAFIIAAPIAFYFMNNWLTDFEYRIDLGFGVFALAGFISLSIAVITVSYHALKAASANPVKSLKYE